MNSTEQQKHKRRTDELQRQIDTLGRGITAICDDFGQTIAKERDAWRSLFDEQALDYIELNDRLERASRLRWENFRHDFVGMSFWRRVRWVITGYWYK